MFKKEKSASTERSTSYLILHRKFIETNCGTVMKPIVKTKQNHNYSDPYFRYPEISYFISPTIL